MTFTTLTFILFLALTFSFYWLFRRRNPQNILLLLASYGFYAWWDYRFCALMLISSMIDFAAALLIARSPSPRARRLWLALSIAGNLGMLGFFKYFSFFAASFAELATGLGWRVEPFTLEVVLPVGISFYTFQTMSYTIDVYRGAAAPTARLIDYLAYVSFFPQLVAGPIERARDLLPQFFTERRFDEAAARDGCRQILWGFFKKMVIADRLGQIVTTVYGPGRDAIGIDAASGPMIAFATVAFAFQIYCDFSAYSDIAIGTAKLFGFRLSRNFAYPYFSRSVGEFWRRWHISLSTWFRDYVFVPLGGSRGGRWRLVRNVMAVFVLSGLWHGASWNFILWGGLMGLALLPSALLAREGKTRALTHDVPGGESLLPRVRSLGAMAATFVIICAGWVLFRTAGIAEAGEAFSTLVTDIGRTRAYTELNNFIHLRGGYWALILIPLLIVCEWLMRRRPHPLAIADFPRPLRWTVYTACFWLTLALSPRSISPFIYFRF